MAAIHRRPWLVWQRLAADVIGERLPTGRYAHPVVVVTVPRQCGKTTWALDIAIGRALQQDNYRAAYAAQTGHVTTARMGERFEELEAGPLAGVVKLRRSAGTERITLPGRSWVKAFPPKPGSLRSEALDLVIVDEAQEHDEILGEALDQTIIPTFTTRPRRQLIVVGTAGTDRSGYLARYLEQARAGTPGHAVIEFGAPNDSSDFDSEQMWHDTHPGLAAGLTDVDALRTARSVLGAAGFLREYGNVWTRVGARLIDPDAWRAVALPPDTMRPAGRLCLSVHVEADRSLTAIGVGAAGGFLELVELRPGVDWAAPRLLELQAAHGAPIALDRHGATGTIAEALELAGATTTIMRALDVANATAGLLDAIAGHTVKIYPAPALDEAVPGAATRRLGDTGGMAFSHRDSATPVAPLVALAAARWGFEHLEPAPVRPQVHAE